MVVFKLNGGHPTRNIILAVSLLAVFVILIFNFSFGRDDSPPAPAHEEETKYVSPRIPTGLKDPVIDTAIQGHNVITSAIFTSWYTSFALLLAYTIRKYNDISKYNAEMVLMVIRKSEQEPDGITERDAEVLQNAGWILRDVEPLKWDSVDLSKIPPNHRTTLNKLHVWNWTEYDRVLYIDADCVVKNEFSDLFRVPGLLAAASDITGDVFVVNSFNAGVLSLRPSRTIFDDYLKKIPSMHLPHEGDQPFLQEYWSLRYWQLPRKYNFNIAMWTNYRDVWNKLWDEASIVHFAAMKPSVRWCREGCDFGGGLMEWYTEQFKEMLAAYKLEGEFPVLG